MKKIDLGQAITILANVGVIAGIVFLAMELQQNNALLAAQASYSQFSIERERRTRLIENIGGIADIVVREMDGEPLSTVEGIRLSMNWLDIVDSWEWQFRELEAGRLEGGVLNVEDWRGQLRIYPGLRQRYENTRGRKDENFLIYMDEILADP